MQEQEIKFRSGDVELAGTITLPGPGGPYPAVLFICGSGPVDRNENAKKFRINAFYDIAHYLAQQNVASLRYDKRGIGQSGGDYWSNGFNGNVTDALAALEYMKQQKDFQPGKIFVLGHSEGALIATRMAAGGADVAGIVLVSGAAHSGEEILKWQALQIVPTLGGFNGWLIRTFHIDVAKSQQKKLDKIKRSTKDWYRQGPVKMNARWWREFMAYDPAADFPAVRVPVLAVTGSKDIQVDPNDLVRMSELVKGDFEYHEIPDMTHMLRAEPGRPSISTYKQQVKQPIDPRLLDIIGQWLSRHVQGQG